MEILRTATHGLHQVDDVIRTAVSHADDASAVLTRTKSIVNPLAPAAVFAPQYANKGLLTWNLLERTSTTPLRGGAGLDDAIRAFESLGAEHGIDSVNLSSTTLRRVGTGFHESGGRILTELGGGDVELGRSIAQQLRGAAERVASFAHA
jgi:hypothetical protein